MIRFSKSFIEDVWYSVLTALAFAVAEVQKGTALEGQARATMLEFCGMKRNRRRSVEKTQSG